MCVAALTRLRQGPQLQHVTQPGPQEPRQAGHHQPPLASAASKSSPWRFFRHLALQDGRVDNSRNIGNRGKREHMIVQSVCTRGLLNGC
jgi:hypothetical protein